MVGRRSLRVVCVLAGLGALAPLLGGCAGRHGGRDMASIEDGASGGDGAAARNGGAVPAGGGLRGISLKQLTDRLGPASFHRTDGPTDLLQYRSDVCVLDVFVYHEVSGDPGRVEHVEARTPTRQPMAEDACIKTVVKANAAQRRG